MGGDLKPLNGHRLSMEGVLLIRGGSKGDGAPKPILANVVTALRANKEFFNVAYDEFSQKIFRAGVPLTDVDFIDITNWIQHQGIHAEVRTVTSAVFMVANECRFNQVKDYLEPLVWDGTQRLEMIFIDHGGAEDTLINRAMTAKWHIQAIARIYQPGCQADHMLILEGAQGLRKSGYFNMIAKPWFIDSISDLGTLAAKQEIRGVWVIEMAEMNNLRKTEANHIKSFMTTKIDHYRDSYGRVAQDFPRQCVLSGTINPGSHGYLKDPTGARRFWPILINEEIDQSIIRDIRDQIWAEALHRYRDGEAWYLDDPALKREAQKIQSDRYEGDVWDESVAEYLLGQTEVTTADVLMHGIKKDRVGDWTRGDEMRVGAILEHFGWKKSRLRRVGKPVNVYKKPDDDAQKQGTLSV